MSEITDEDAAQEALRTELILEEIFKCLPMESLLCCSQVNKLWNYQARLYIRDQRKCTARIHSCAPPCSRLKELDELIGGMTVVPFNSLIITLGQHSNCCGGGVSAASPHRNLESKFRIKHLFITSGHGLETCPGTFRFLRVLLYTASAIKSFRLHFIPPFLLMVLAKLKPVFPKLEELEILGVMENSIVKRACFLQAFLRASPKLERFIHSGDQSILWLLPQDKYHLLTKFSFDEFTRIPPEGREDRCMTLANSGPALSDLQFWISTRTEQSIRACYEMLQLFLCSGCKSLQHLQIYRICELHSMMTFPPLEKLTYLRMHCFVGSDQFMNIIKQIQFGRLFPKARRICLQSIPSSGPLRIFSRSPQWEDETEVEVVPGSFSSSTSTSGLEITADVCHISFFQLKQIFPYVTDLAVFPLSNGSHAVPFRQIFRLWPQLKRLTVCGQAMVELYNCDAEFCGLDQAEVELLWLMEEVELKNLQIVPRRPCPITMRSLELIDIALSLAYNFDAMPNERPQKFLSVVTKCLLLERVPSLNLLVRIDRGDDVGNFIFDIND